MLSARPTLDSTAISHARSRAGVVFRVRQERRDQQIIKAAFGQFFLVVLYVSSLLRSLLTPLFDR